ncbi:hypothetical protein [Kribbella voronezhensis]|uniref:hypothetical protein n=1 Tax=Kribbella voronezhensis TaxID=2512212 RepID=UPI0010636F19|nr:hypothetical protein [Kribbella voronezhensis]
MFVLMAIVVALLGALLQPATATATATAADPQPTPTQPGKAGPAAPPAGKKAKPEHARPPGLELTRPSKSTAETIAACSGALGGGVILTCDSATSDDVHTYSLTTAKPQESVLFRLTGMPDLHVEAYVPNGDESTCFIQQGTTKCDFAVPGTHTVTLHVYSGSGSYKFSAVGLDDAPCKTLAAHDLAVGSAGTPGQLVDGQFGDCFQFSGAADEVFRFGAAVSTAVVYDASGAVACSPEWSGRLACKLTGTGPYRAFVTQLAGVNTGYTFHLVKLNSPVGCAPLPLAPFGDPGDAVATGDLALGQMACRTVTATAGRHWIQNENSVPDQPAADSEVYGRQGEEACTEGTSRQTCTLAADGTYTILLENRETAAGFTFRLSVLELAKSTGCAPVVGTRWDLPQLHKTAASTLSLDCQPIDAVAGERILARQVVESDGHFTTIVDGSGEDACDPEGNYDGCLLKGTGPFRVLSGAAVGDPEYVLDIGRLSDPIGCTSAQVSSFNQTPPTAPAGSRCRTLTVSTQAQYVIDDGTGHSRGAYGEDGVARCSDLPNCELPAGKYTIVASATTPVSIFPITSTAGCAAQPADTFAARSGVLAGRAQYDCLTLSSAVGSEVLPVEPAGRMKTEGRIVDADGSYVCGWQSWLDPSTCKLTGQAPYRALIHRSPYQENNNYSFAVPRIDSPGPCAAFPQHDFSTTTGTALTLNAARFITCLTIAAGSHSAMEAFQYARTATTGMARIFVKTPGEGLCDGPAGTAEFTWCPMTAGKAYTALVVGSDQSAAYQVARRDITSTAKGCSGILSSNIGATAGTGTIADGAALRCFRVTSAAVDQYVVNTRGAASVGATVFRPSGQIVCKTFGELRCSVNGSTGYQVIVWSDPNFGTPGAFKLEAARLSTAAGPAPECVRAPSAAYGFGPLTGEVNATKTMNCVTFPLGKTDQVSGTAVNTVSGGPVPHLYGRSANGADNCMWGAEPLGTFDCWGNFEAGTVSEMMLFGLPETQTSLKYTVSATCQQPLCGGAVFGVTSAAPKTGVVGTTVNVTLKGSALHSKDVVRLTAAGKPAITGVMRSVTADRTTSVYAFNLTGAALGVRNVVVDSFAGASATLPNAFTVLGAASRATKAPVLSQTPQVNHTVVVSTGTWSPTCSSYGYQWYSGGVALTGATKTSLLLTASTANKTLYAAVTCTRPSYATGRALSNTVTVRP